MSRDVEISFLVTRTVTPTTCFTKKEIPNFKQTTFSKEYRDEGGVTSYLICAYLIHCNDTFLLCINLLIFLIIILGMYMYLYTQPREFLCYTSGTSDFQILNFIFVKQKPSRYLIKELDLSDDYERNMHVVKWYRSAHIAIITV